MDSNKGDQNSSSRVVRGGEIIDISKIDPKYIDDYRDRFEQKDEERLERNEPSSFMDSCSSQGSGKSSSRT